MGFGLGTNPTGFAILEAGMGTPIDSLVARQDAGSLSFEEKKALGQSRAVVMGGGGEGDETEEKQRSHGNEVRHFRDLWGMGNGVCF